MSERTGAAEYGADDYLAFLADRSQQRLGDGFAPTFMPSSLIDFQAGMVDWSTWIGRGALLEDCGLGKTFQYLCWAENVVRHTNRPVLVLAPVAVTQQTAREARKFDIEAHISRDGTVRPGINLTNYERLHHFNPNDFAGVVGDESSILKSYDGERRAQITEFMRKIRYRLLCTATAAPNAYTELGTSSEALGYLGYMDMLTRFFKNNQGNSIKPFTTMHRGKAQKPAEILEESAKWRFKGHAEIPFWKWVCSWARACRRPSDLGFEDGAFILPPLTERQHMVEAERAPSGMLFSLPAIGLQEQREERRRTIKERCEHAAALVNDTGKPAIAWCHLNDEGDLLEKLIPGCVQVSGRDSDEEKEEKFLAFLDGQARVLVSKGKIAGWGLNFQHCAHCVAFPTHSYEEYYQEVRRCWRFGQKNPVMVDIVTTEGEKSVLENLQRKSVAADRMFSELVRYMNDAMQIDRNHTFNQQEGVPAWLS